MSGRYHPTFASIRNPQEDQARAVPEFLRGAVMYQLFLRPFTQEGTLTAAQALLPHIRSLGVDIIYLCPVTVADDDERKDYWSHRQDKSGLNNSRNPYRVKDYFGVDSEYGTAEELKAFVADVHQLGMRILFDLVYFHCGPSAVFLKDHPEFIVRDEQGLPKLGDWRFPELDFTCDALRNYLYDNMLYFIQEYHVDGFRCDVADMIPVDFWETALRRCRALNPECILMCEGLRGDDQHEAFDLTYGFYTQWAIRDILRGKADASELQEACMHELTDYPRGFHWMRCFDNHDFAMDTSLSGGRYEATAGTAACECMLAFIFLINGLPMIYNGQEIADNQPHSIFSNREHGRLGINWSRGFTSVGQHRLDVIRTMTALRHRHPDLFDSPVEWLAVSEPKTIFAFRRKLHDNTITLVGNVSAQSVEFTVEDRHCSLPPHGYAIWEAETCS